MKMNKMKIGLLCLCTLVLSACSMDDEAPTFELNNNVVIDYGLEIGQQDLLDKVVNNVEDNTTNTEDIELEIENFSDFDTANVGSYELTITAIDEAKNEKTQNVNVEVAKTADQLLSEAQEQYLVQLDSFNVLLTEKEYQKYEEEINALDETSYQEYESTLEDYENKHVNSIVKDIKENKEKISTKLTKLEDKYDFDTKDMQNQLDEINFSKEDYESLIDAQVSSSELLEKTSTKLLDEQEKAAKEAEEKAEKEAKEAEEKAEKEAKEAEEKEAEEAQAAEEQEAQAAVASTGDSSLAANTELNLEACSLSGYRQPNAKVDIGYDSSYANREYWAYTNSASQLVYVSADEIIVQNDDVEPVKSNDRYCSDEAKVDGVEASDLDEGHVIADSLGGVSNAYNITPQESQLNRYGTQADIEESIRSAGGATNFEANISYPDSTTMIPSSYSISYYINGTPYSYDFSNDYEADSVYVSEPVVEEPVVEEPVVEDTTVYYENCTDVRDHGANPLYRGDAGWQDKFDRDGDGVACE